MKKRKTPGAYTIVIGCGPHGEAIARRLSERGEQVLVVDASDEALRTLPASFGGDQWNGDATKREVLNRIQTGSAAAVVVATGSENTNIMISQIVREEYHVPVVVACSGDPKRRFLYERSGAMPVAEGEFTGARVAEYLIAKKAG